MGCARRVDLGLLLDPRVERDWDEGKETAHTLVTSLNSGGGGEGGREGGYGCLATAPGINAIHTARYCAE